MRRLPALTEDQAFRLGAGLIGLTLTTSGALAADLAREHMAFVGAICGASPHPHCGWCYGAAGLVLVGLAAFAAAARPVHLSQIKAELPRR